MPETSGDVTQMLVAYGEGDRQALDELLPLGLIRSLEHCGALLKRRAGRPYTAADRSCSRGVSKARKPAFRKVAKPLQFYGIAATAMRRILVNHALAKAAEKTRERC